MPEQDPICSLDGYLQSIGMAADTMAGIPTWMSAIGVVAIILLSHGLVAARRDRVPKTESPSRVRRGLDLLGFRPIRRLVAKPYFPLMMQSLSLFLFLLVISAGLFGNQRNNIAPVLTWTWWWVLLIFLVLGFGKTFCMVCPWEAVSSLVTSLSLRSRKKALGYERPWPKWARNILPAIGFFVVLTWFELGHDVTHSPSQTATLALVMVGMAALTAIVFEKRAFCRYACLVGRISGLYALFSPVELRPRSTDICAKCTGKECYHGSESATGCPTNLFPGALKENTYCTLCTECVRSCPHDNIGIHTRPFASDLLRKTTFRWDESVLAIVLLALTSFHGFTMTPVWTSSTHWLRAETGLGGTAVFTVLMAVLLLAPILLFWIGAKAAERLTPDARVPAVKIFKAFSYSLVPVALFYHLAHNCMHFFLEAGALFPLLSDPFGVGWNLFGTADKTYGPLLTLPTIWWLQIVCIVVGHVYGVLIADRVAKRLFSNRSDAARSLVPLLITMVLYSCFSVWLIAQPMEMRSGM